jgi:hypothetical protein
LPNGPQDLVPKIALTRSFLSHIQPKKIA